jgi:hypothetical protein
MFKVNWRAKLLLLLIIVLVASFLFQLLYIVPAIERRDLEMTQSNHTKIAQFVVREVTGTVKRFETRLHGLARMEACGGILRMHPL